MSLRGNFLHCWGIDLKRANCLYPPHRLDLTILYVVSLVLELFFLLVMSLRRTRILAMPLDARRRKIPEVILWKDTGRDTSTLTRFNTNEEETVLLTLGSSDSVGACVSPAKDFSGREGTSLGVFLRMMKRAKCWTAGGRLARIGTEEG
ncbi:hypothetical protein PROFUN_05423 [Planoprotostelium fungivorum]|uniref:Uncharacterized protein n=1 Tax=Planoprotostelium fungivorum TaxID=1890364 RepID=A0A2P6NQP6_9EUKA|nr:hypothetical protein PROFUN_05423 [Planoprotostelium fungivorum]